MRIQISVPSRRCRLVIFTNQCTSAGSLRLRYHRGMTEEPNQPIDPQAGEGSSEPDASFMAVFGRLGLAGWLGLAWAVVPAVAGITLLTRMKPVSQWIIELAGQGGADRWQSVGVYVLGFVVLSGVGVLPTFAISVLGGYAFGPVVGFAAALAGFGGASVVGYLIARLIAREKVEQEIRRHEKARVVRNALVRSGFAKTLLIVTLVRVPPNSPFALMNGTLATTGVGLPAYVIGTLVGMAPRTFAYVLIGQQVTDWSDAKTPRWMIIAGIVVTIVVLMIIGSIANKALQRVTGSADQAGC